jgi:hypothetical protein
MRKAIRQNRNHPRAIPIAPQDSVAEAEMPFAEGSNDQLDPDLRHRLISERAYARYCERDYADGYDLDDWLEAEAEVDHVTILPRGAA